MASSVLEILLSLFLLRSVGAPKEELSPAENLAIFGKESSPSSISVSVWKVPFRVTLLVTPMAYMFLPDSTFRKIVGILSSPSSRVKPNFP